MLDACSDPTVEQVVLKTSSQIGKTEVIGNIIGYFVDQDPAPMIVLQPTILMARAWSEDRLKPMLRDTPRLKGRITDARVRDSGNSILHKTFAGGHITMAGSNAAASLASRPVRVVCADEVDRYPLSAGIEGDPVALVKKRTQTFWNRKIILTSTPTTEGVSRIDMAFQESDQRFYYIPCPHCGEMQKLVWAQVSWPKGEPENAVYGCVKCGCVITDPERQAALKQGEWRATEPFRGTAGFHLSELYSPWSDIPKIALAFVEANKSTDTLKTWVNTCLGECWRADEGEKVEWEQLYARREHYPEELNKHIRLLVAGIDVQDDRIEYEIIGYGAEEQSWGIQYGRLQGDPGRPDLWARLTERMQQTFRREDGIDLEIRLCGIDSGGHYTDEVYAWCKKFGITRAIPVKGHAQNGKPIANFPRTKNRQGVYLTMVGTDTAKELIYSRYRQLEPGPGYCRWPVSEEYDEVYFQQATAEVKVRKYRKGVAYFEWDARGRRNEATDNRVYALAMVRILQQHFGLKLGKIVSAPPESLDKPEKVAPKKAPIPRKKGRPRQAPSTWVGNTGSWL